MIYRLVLLLLWSSSNFQPLGTFSIDHEGWPGADSLQTRQVYIYIYIYIYVALLLVVVYIFGRAQRCMERSSASHIEIKDIQMICKLGLHT